MASKKRKPSSGSKSSKPSSKKSSSSGKSKSTARSNTSRSINKASKKKPSITSPKKELDSVRKELKSVRNKVYYFNKKIKSAPNRYQAGKIKKQRNELVAKLDPQIQSLTAKRDKLKQDAIKYDKYVHEKRKLAGKIGSIKRQIKKADEDRDYDKLKKLSHQELKYLGQLDNLNEENGVEMEHITREDIDRDEMEDDGGANFELDDESPYAIWEAVKQLDRDLAKGVFKTYIIDTAKLPAQNVIQIQIEASQFWINTKNASTYSTPWVNRYINSKIGAVKYLPASI